MNPSTLTLFKIRSFTALVSLLLSTLAYYFDDLINGDGILYMEIAEAYLQGGLAETVKHYNWPFFSILVSYVHKLTSFPLEISAYILNTLLFVLLTDALVQISHKILPDTRHLAIAALLILCFPSFNEYRHFIIRDIGYWAFCSLALYRFILFLEMPSIKNATLWQLFMLIAILFRVEGVVILLGLPLYLLFTRSPKLAVKQGLQLYYLLIIGVFGAILLSLGQSDLSTAFGKITTVTHYINIDGLLEEFNKNAAIIETQILNRYSIKYSGLILASGLIVILIYKLTKAISIGYIIIYIVSRWKQLQQQPFPYQSLIIYLALLNVLILLVFIFNDYFISKRYSVLALISFLLLMLPRLTSITEHAWSFRKKLLLTFIATILLVSLVESMTYSNSKSYIKDVAIWASQNLPKDSAVLTDDAFIEYYFNNHHPEAGLIRAKIKSYQRYDYLIVVEKRKHKELKAMLSTMKLEPMFNLENRRGDKATVYIVQAIK